MELDLLTLYALAGAGLVSVLGMWHVVRARPQLAISVAFLLILIAGTKFRTRDALRTDADSQILLELGLYCLIAAITMMLFATSQKRRRVLGPLDLLPWGYVLVCMASFVWSLAPMVTAVRAFQALVLLCLVSASARVVGTEYMMRALTAACTLYVLSFAASVPLVPHLHGLRDDLRFSWFAVHPITAGSLAAIAVLGVLSIGFFSVARWRDRLLCCPLWLFPLPLITILILANSRGPLLAFVGGLSVLLLKRFQRSTAIVVTSLVFVAILAIVGSTTSINSYLETSQTSDDIEASIVRRLLRGQTAEEFMGLSGRAELWENTLGSFFEEPLTGHGYQGSRILLLSTVAWAGHAHNGYVQTLLDVGILGSIFLFPMFLLILASGLPGGQRRVVSWEECAAIGVMTFLVLNSISDESFAVAGYPLVVAFACASIAARRRFVELPLARRRYAARVHVPAARVQTASRTAAIRMGPV